MIPMVAHFAEHMMPAAVREGVVKPHRASHWHHDVLCHADEGELRKRIWNARWAHALRLVCHGEGLGWLTTTVTPEDSGSLYVSVPGFT